MMEITTWDVDPNFERSIDQLVKILIVPVVDGVWVHDDKQNIMGIVSMVYYDADELVIWMKNVAEPIRCDRHIHNVLVQVMSDPGVK